MRSGEFGHLGWIDENDCPMQEPNRDDRKSARPGSANGSSRPRRSRAGRQFSVNGRRSKGSNGGWYHECWVYPDTKESDKTTPRHRYRGAPDYHQG